jgi:hypothetical protein
MKFIARFFSFMLMIGLPSSMLGQNSHPQIEVTGSTSVSSGHLAPLWFYANEWGKYSMTPDLQASFYASIKDTLMHRQNFNLRAGVGGILSTEDKISYLHEAYVAGNWGFLDYSVGLEAYSPIVYDDRLTSGSYLISSNARPIPRISLGAYQWTNVPFTKSWAQFKAGISQGYLNDQNDGEPQHEKVYLHEKFGYLRLNHYAIKPYVGLVHSALFGGEGNKVDFIATFFAKGSSKLGGGEETNAAGAHMGLYDFGVDYRSEIGLFHLYYQKPFADGSGMRLYNGRNKDFNLGLCWYPANGKIVKGIGFEFIKTSYQSGPGMPDPIYPEGHPKEGQIIFMDDIDDVDQFMQDEFGVTTEGWNEDDLMTYLEDTYNHGYSYGGRDDNMNNGSYPAGWSYYGMSTGTPLIHTVNQVSAYAGDWNFSKGWMFVNNRVDGFNVAVNGEVAKLTYMVKLTYTQNYGSYNQEYPGRYTWERVADYYYDTHKVQYYSLLDLKYPLLKDQSLVLGGIIGLDWGELYHSEGVRLSLCWMPQF